MIRILIMIFAILIFGCTEKNPKAEERIISIAGIELTADEKQYIKDHPVITWAAENRPPILYKDGGEIVGRVPKYLKIVAKSTGLTFKPVFVADIPSALAAVRSGQIDLVTSIRPTTDRMDLGFTAPFANSKAVFLFRFDDMPAVPMRAGVLKGDAAIDYLASHFPTIKIIETESHDEAIELLGKGLVDVAIMHEAVAGYIMKKRHKKLFKVQTDFTYQSCFGFRKEDVLLGSILSKVILLIDVEDKRYINDAWKRQP